MKFLDGINRIVNRKDPASVSALAFLLLVISVIGWEWYAIGTRTTVPHIEAILGFALAIMVNKHVKDVKMKGDDNVPQ